MSEETKEPGAGGATTLLDAPADKAAAPESKGSLLNEGKDGSKSPDAGADKNDTTKTGEKATTETGKDGKPSDQKTVGAPETYADPKLPEGFNLNKEVMAKFNADAKAMNLTQDQYQTLIDRQIEVAKSNEAQAVAELNRRSEEWKQEAIKELGADYQKELASASKAIDTVFKDPEQNKSFREMMSVTGLGNWPPMIRLCTFIGKAISEDPLIEGKNGTKEEKSLAQKLYPSMPSST